MRNKSISKQAAQAKQHCVIDFWGTPLAMIEDDLGDFPLGVLTRNDADAVRRLAGDVLSSKFDIDIYLAGEPLRAALEGRQKRYNYINLVVVGPDNDLSDYYKEFNEGIRDGKIRLSSIRSMFSRDLQVTEKHSKYWRYPDAVAYMRFVAHPRLLSGMFVSHPIHEYFIDDSIFRELQKRGL